MFEQVFEQSLFLAEFFITEIACEWLFAGVGAQMTFDCIRMPEILPAILARVRFFATVQPHVTSIALRISEGSSTFLTANEIFRIR